MTNAIYTQHCAKKFTHVIYVKMILLAGVATFWYQRFLSRATGSFVSSAVGPHVFGGRPKTRAAKPREKTAFRVRHFKT